MARSDHSSSPDGSPASPREPVPDGSAAAGGRRPRPTGALVEWAIWLAVAFFFYAQTGRFDQEIATYRFGATGWPRTLAICVGLGATGQMLYRLFRDTTPSPVAEAIAEDVSAWTWAQRLGILSLPIVWLWTIPYVGFYVSTPFFVLALLLILEVRSLRALIGVTFVVYALVLLIFTRFFYVGLPTGQLDGFYEANNWIIATARWGG
ncbi:MAG TPA: tripartite tricarboxylate transporter TctB family protein [Thermohalobaculum sp.]|nr:tripartite tricarboxylate transporter TctB family protein [Thermohalobaculum sp.]